MLRGYTWVFFPMIVPGLRTLPQPMSACSPKKDPIFLKPVSYSLSPWINVGLERDLVKYSFLILKNYQQHIFLQQ